MTRGPMREGSMIFGARVNKSGMTWIARSVEILDYPALHDRAPGRETRNVDPATRRAVEEGEHPFAHLLKLGDYRAPFDLHAVEEHSAALEAASPGSRFIPHARDLDSLAGQSRAERAGQYCAWVQVHRCMADDRPRRVGRPLADPVSVGAGFRPPRRPAQVRPERRRWLEGAHPFPGTPVPDVPFPWKQSAPARNADSFRRASASWYPRCVRWGLRRLPELLRP